MKREPGLKFAEAVRQVQSTGSVHSPEDYSTTVRFKRMIREQLTIDAAQDSSWKPVTTVHPARDTTPAPSPQEQLSPVPGPPDR
jgi:hypothetical protein